jgi:DNA modification methylase
VTFVDKILEGDAVSVLKTLPSEFIDCCITSPPYWGLRDYDVEGQLGLEPDFRDYIENLCNVFDEVKRVLKPDGTCWVNLGDTYSTVSGRMGSDTKEPKWRASHQAKGFKQPRTNLPDKTLVQIPSRFALAMSDRGWILRNEIIWHKPNCMPQSVKDRFTVDFEKLFFFAKRKRYYFETQSEPTALDSTTRSAAGYETSGRNLSIESRSDGHASPPSLGDRRNKRTVWTITTKPLKDAHFAVFPEGLVETPVKAGCPPFGIVLDPFMGAGTTALVARKLARHYVGIELNRAYIKIANRRLCQQVLTVA